MVGRTMLTSGGTSEMRSAKKDCMAYLPEVAGIPIDLYQSMQGHFFAGLAEHLEFGGGTSAWAGLFNPPGSGVDLYVWAFAITGVRNTAYRIQIWFNGAFPGTPQISANVSPTNTAIVPLPVPQVQLQYASGVEGSPTGGALAFVRRGQPETSIFSIEEGKFVFPPGGSFGIFLSDPETPDIMSSGNLYFEWWEEDHGP